MKYTNVALKDKIQEMYPGIAQHKISLGVTYHDEKNAYVLKFKRGTAELVTHLDKLDADDCMNNIRCVHLGIKVDQFVVNFEARNEFGRKVA
jgi:hypothetical protein